MKKFFLIIILIFVFLIFMLFLKSTGIDLDGKPIKEPYKGFNQERKI
ncbi:MAG: hypothetical protein HYW77_02020 [Parcubacteria group bacterium]|nr:hypothetical protein [Parcubacteria group bacterium]